MIAMTRSFSDKDHNKLPRPATRPLGSFAAILPYPPHVRSEMSDIVCITSGAAPVRVAG